MDIIVRKAGLLEIFWVFLKIGAFTVGGGYAMIPLIEDAMLKRKWIDEQEMPNIIALSQSAPGVLAVNISIFAGHKLRGLKGSLVATFAAILPSLISIILVALFFQSFQNNIYVIKIFKGLRPVVAALIVIPMVTMAKKNNDSIFKYLISIGTLISVCIFKISPIYILCIIILIGLYKSFSK